MSVQWTDDGNDTFHATLGNFDLAVWNPGNKEDGEHPWHYEVDLPMPVGLASFHFYHGQHKTKEDAQHYAEARAREVAMRDLIPRLADALESDDDAMWESDVHHRFHEDLIAEARALIAPKEAAP